MYVIYKNKIDWLDGLILMLSYFVYIIYMFTSMKTVEEINLISNNTQGKGEMPILKSIVYFDFVNIFFRKKSKCT